MWGAVKDKKNATRLGIGLVAGLAAGAAPGQQSSEPGAELFLDVRTGIVVSDNYDRNRNNDVSGDLSTVSETNITLGYDARNDSQAFEFRLGGRLEFGTGPDEVVFENGLTNPFLSIGYVRTGKSTELALDVSTRERQNAFITEIDQETGEDVINDGGSRRDTNYNAILRTGIDGPLQTRTRLFYRLTDYIDATSNDLNDTQRYGAEFRARLALERNLDLTFDANYNRREVFSTAETRETNRGIGVGLEGDINPSLSFAASIGYAVNEVTTTTSSTETTRPTLSFSLDQQMQNGTLGMDFRRSLNQNGSLTTLRFSRDLDLRAGSLSASLGTTWTNDDRAHAIGSLSWTHEWKASQLRASVSRAVQPVDDEGDRVVTAASVGYTREITRISDVSFEIGHTIVDNLADDGIDSTRTNATVTYSHRLTEDWSLNAGVSHFVSEADGREAISENRVFANIGKRFSLRP